MKPKQRQNDQKSGIRLRNGISCGFFADHSIQHKRTIDTTIKRSARFPCGQIECRTSEDQSVRVTIRSRLITCSTTIRPVHQKLAHDGCTEGEDGCTKEPGRFCGIATPADDDGKLRRLNAIVRLKIYCWPKPFKMVFESHTLASR